jgi:hypothetical protein
VGIVSIRTSRQPIGLTFFDTYCLVPSLPTRAREMKNRNGKLVARLLLAIGPLIAAPSFAMQAKLVERPPDPHGSPRPARDARNVPVKTSIYFELGTPAPAKAADVSPESVSVRLQEQGGESVELLRPGRRFGAGTSGWMRPKQDLQGVESLAVYIEPGEPLKPVMK